MSTKSVNKNSEKTTQKSGNTAKRLTTKAATGPKTAPKKGGAKAGAPEILPLPETSPSLEAPPLPEGWLNDVFIGIAEEEEAQKTLLIQELFNCMQCVCSRNGLGNDEIERAMASPGSIVRYHETLSSIDLWAEVICHSAILRSVFEYARDEDVSHRRSTAQTRRAIERLLRELVDTLMGQGHDFGILWFCLRSEKDSKGSDTYFFELNYRLRKR